MAEQASWCGVDLIGSSGWEPQAAPARYPWGGASGDRRGPDLGPIHQPNAQRPPSQCHHQQGFWQQDFWLADEIGLGTLRLIASIMPSESATVKVILMAQRHRVPIVRVGVPLI